MIDALLIITLGLITVGCVCLRQKLEVIEP